ncbi:ATP synthase protein I [Tistlia consotensis]|uniref:ATP synthase protein I n=1 Tax=Tistlia consotensis USBA 355 TaxID=560819 RepID=A0A1Y6CH96_9PROT|nr:AtpZ/AtpI family protein [Tistlia consotensis]SMF62513.1 ATP synthase protein I [Tistlia consotensis USBA 355]SNR94840.1 ATP synthase protein I [Tistlia consotensis]
MTDGDEPRPGDGSGGRLEARISAARKRRDDGRRRVGSLAGGGTNGLAVGLRIASEMVAALAVSIGIGLLLDTWLGTKPWLMLLFVVLGVMTAFYNVVRTAKELERRRKAEKAQAGPPAADERRG